MSHWVSYLADLTDPTFATAEVDLNGAETLLGGPFETDPDTFDLGAPGMDGVWLYEDGKDEDVLSAHRRGRVEATFNLRIAPGAAFLTGITDRLRKLNAALDRAGVWVLQQPGMPTPLYIDYYPSPLIQQLMPGERSLFHLFTQLQQPNGMPVTILRRPKMRGAALDASVNLAHNGTLAEDHDADGLPTFWTWNGDHVNFPNEGYDWTYGAHEASLSTTAARYFYQTSDDGVVAAGRTFTFALDVAASYSALPQVRCRIDWLDGSNVLIGSSLYGAAMTLLFGPSLGFARPFVTGTAPTGAVHARYGVEFVDVDANPVVTWLRKAQLEQGATATAFRPGFEVVSNDVTAPFGKRLWLVNDGNADALAQLRATPDASAQIAQMTYSRRSGARDSAMAMRYAKGFHAVDATSLLSGSTNVSGESGTISGHAVKSSLSNDVLKPLFRHAMLPVEESALRGTWTWKAAIRGDLNDAYALELRYGLGNVNDLPRRAAPELVQLDLNGPPTTSDYYVVELGKVRVPAASPALYVELHAMRVTTDDGDMDGELYVDQVWPEPADDDVSATATIPGATTPGVHTERLLGKALTTPPATLVNDPATSTPFEAGTIYGTRMQLNDQWEACAVPLAWTDDLNAVTHTFVLDTIMFTDYADSDHKKLPKVHGEFRIHDLADLTITGLVGRAVLRNEAGTPWSEKLFTLRFTPTAGHAYIVYVVQTVATSVGNVHVLSISHSFVPPISGSDDQTIAVDADQRRAYVLESGEFVSDFPLLGPYPTLQPKVQLYRVSFAGMASHGSDDVLDGGAALRHDPARTALMGFHVIPRWTN